MIFLPALEKYTEILNYHKTIHGQKKQPILLMQLGFSRLAKQLESTLRREDFRVCKNNNHLKLLRTGVCFKQVVTGCNRGHYITNPNKALS